MPCPGRLTSTWFQAEHEGIFYGQCSELCGMNHAFMPIGVRVVKQEVFDEWAGAMKAKDKKKAKEILDKVALEQAGVKEVADGSGQSGPLIKRGRGEPMARPEPHEETQTSKAKGLEQWAAQRHMRTTTTRPPGSVAGSSRRTTKTSGRCISSSR